MGKKKIEINKKGVSGVDISVAIVVITIGMSIIISLLTIISQTTSKVNREIEATLIGKSVFEKINTIPYLEFIEIVKDSSNEHYEESLGVRIPDGFILQIEIEDEEPTTSEEAVLYGVRKKGNIKIEYMLGREFQEINFPFVKNFDKVLPLNKPNLNDSYVISSFDYSSLSPFEAIDDNEDLIPENMIDEWREYKTGEYNLDDLSTQKYARRMNSDGDYDKFVWIPRFALMYDEDEDREYFMYLIGKTNYALEDFVKEIIAPNGDLLTVVISGLVEQKGTIYFGEFEGTWVNVDELDDIF